MRKKRAKSQPCKRRGVRAKNEAHEVGGGKGEETVREKCPN